MIHPRRIPRDSLRNLVRQFDGLSEGATAPDTLPTGFKSLDRVIGGGLRKRDLVLLGGEIGSGKSALALAFALRVAGQGRRVSFFSGEMDEDRLMERALAIEARITIDDLRQGHLTEESRAQIGAAALRLREAPLDVFSMVGRQFDEVLDVAWDEGSELIVVDCLQLLPPPTLRGSLEEDTAAAVRALKALALEHDVACLAVSQLPDFQADRPDPRPTLDDFGALGSVKQIGDLVLGIFREEMFNPGGGVEGATELIIAKNRNGPTGFIDLYFRPHCMRFEDMLDPD
jgi:replicative DNA helicase